MNTGKKRRTKNNKTLTLPPFQMKLDSGHAVTPVEGEEKARLKKTFVGYPDGLVRVSPDRWLFPGRYMDLGNDYYNFEVYGTLLRSVAEVRVVRNSNFNHHSFF